MMLQNLQHFACLIRPWGPTLKLGNFYFSSSKKGSGWQKEKQLTLGDREFLTLSHLSQTQAKSHTSTLSPRLSGRLWRLTVGLVAGRKKSATSRLMQTSINRDRTWTCTQEPIPYSYSKIKAKPVSTKSLVSLQVKQGLQWLLSFNK